MERIHFRFTWRNFLRWSGIVFLAALAGLAFALYFLDWNQMRGPLGRYFSARTAREVRIDGNLSVRLFSWQPAIDAAGIYIGNPAWVGTPKAARVKELRVEFRLVPLLLGKLILPLVRIDEPDILLVRDAGGRTNWDRGGRNPNEAFRLPPINRFLINNGHLRIDDAVRRLHFTGTVSSQEGSNAGRAVFALKGDGTLNQNKFLANVTGEPLLNVDQSKPYHFNADVRAGETHALVKGAITQPFHLDRFTAAVDVSGPSLADLYFMTGLVLPNTPPYRLNDIQALLGATDLQGNLSVDASGALPMLSGKVASRVLNFSDLGPLVGGGNRAAAAGKYILPQTVLHTERLRQANAEVDYSARAIASRDFPLRSLGTHISVQGGVLNLKPLAFGFVEGKLSGSLKVDARSNVPVSSLDARLTDIRAENFIKGSDKPIQGTLEARAVLTGTGNSVHEAAANASGTVTAVVPSGGMRHSLAEWAGIDVLSALSLNLAGDNSNTNLRCAVASFGARKGVLSAQTFVIDTDPVRLDGTGTIDLRDETLDMRLQGKPKNFQLLRLRAPITLKGSLAHPALGVEAGAMASQGGLGAVLGLVNPLAAILAFIDPGLAKDANCGPLLAAAKGQGAPVKDSAVKSAPPPRK